ncbi:MAG: helix-turn-helix domain-containing protein [Clostridium sp.]|nr:helix-turn-helix domain-containing protein [Clostridium sp.]
MEFIYMITEQFILEFQKRLHKALLEHRKKKHLTQQNVADKMCISLDTYKRLEHGKYLDIFKLLSVFQELDFSAAEIIDVLGLPLLTGQEIKENAIYSTVRENCHDMDNMTLEKLLSIICAERANRLEKQR